MTFDVSSDWHKDYTTFPLTPEGTQTAAGDWKGTVCPGDPWTANTTMTLKTEATVGELVPYSVRTDNILSLTLLVCVGLFVVSLSESRRTVGRQLKSFFTARSSESTEPPPVWSWFSVVMAVIDCLLLGLLAYILVTERLASRLTIENPVLLTALFTSLFMIYFLLKWLLYELVNRVFFNSKKCLHWNASFLLLISLEGVLMLPIALLVVYFDLSLEKAVWYFIFVLFLNKMLAFYKSWMIFFRQNGRVIQNFLYLCALEITPLLAFCGIGLILINTIKVNL